MKLRLAFVSAAGLLLGRGSYVLGQSADSVMARIWSEGMRQSQMQALARPLLDSIGPRVTGSPEQRQASQWVLDRFRAWQIPARAEQYGTWMSWRRGITHIDLVAPRIRSLEGTLLTFSAGTQGIITGGVTSRPSPQSRAEFDAWLAHVRGKFVLGWFPEPSCRPNEDWSSFGRPESVAAFQSQRRAARDSFNLSTRRNAPT